MDHHTDNVSMLSARRSTGILRRYAAGLVVALLAAGGLAVASQTSPRPAQCAACCRLTTEPGLPRAVCLVGCIAGQDPPGCVIADTATP